MFALSGALAGAANAGGGGGAGSFAGRPDVAGVGAKEAVLIVEGGFLDMNDPRQADSLARALEQLSGRRVVVREG